VTRILVLIGLTIAVVVCAAPVAAAGRISVGLAPGSSVDDVGAALEAATGGYVTADLGPLDALVLDVPDVDVAAAAASTVAGVEYAEPVTTSTRTLAFRPNDPFAVDQWYLPAIHAFDHWAQEPPLAPILVAVIDSGIDGSHPEFAGRIAASRSFVSSAATVDSYGHGTMVAGEIAAMLDNAEGIAGVGIPVQLLVAKVIASDGGISLLAEARAIRWAVDRGAQVINLSIGGPRDPNNPWRDTYSELERSAIDYATRNGVVVVAAGGNCFDICPDPYAGYPAALPHVLGVSAIARNGSTPLFSNRDRIYNDLAAPGTEILSTYPLARSLAVDTCPRSGYTQCARTTRHRSPSGTSFSAPLAAAAAAVLIAETGRLSLGALHPSQVTHLLERAAVDVRDVGRDRFSGWGRLDVQLALERLSRPLPPADQYETNDDAGGRARPLWGSNQTVRATLDRFDDRRDVYRITIREGQRVVFRVTAPDGTNVNMVLWRPGTKHVTGRARRIADRIAFSANPGSSERIAYRARRDGWFFLEVRLDGGWSAPYELVIAKS
jgi:subtilisin family serine protease